MLKAVWQLGNQDLCSGTIFLANSQKLIVTSPKNLDFVHHPNGLLVGCVSPRNDRI